VGLTWDFTEPNTTDFGAEWYALPVWWNGMAIGAFYAEGKSTRWNGLMDDFGIWNNALSEAEIQDIMNNGINPPSSCGEPGTAYLQGDINKNCYVNFLDFAALGTEWFECTDPNMPLNCEPYP
jgi:hypothetical protein